jgi:hypothetical protein
VKLYVRSGGAAQVAVEDRRRDLLEEGSEVAGYRTYSTTRVLLEARIFNESCVNGTCTQAPTWFRSGPSWRPLAYTGEAFSGFLGVSSGSSSNWYLPRQHGWVQVDVTEDLQFSVQAYGYETEMNVASVIGAGRPAAVVAQVPLPAAGWVLLAGLGALGALRRR